MHTVDLENQQRAMLAGLCPECDEVMSSMQIHLREGVALCPRCGSLIRLSKLNYRRRFRNEIVKDPPLGCCLQRSRDEVQVKVSLRSRVGRLVAGLMCLNIFAIFASVLSGLIFAILQPPRNNNQGDQAVEILTRSVLVVLLLLLLCTVFRFFFKRMMEFAYGELEVSTENEEAYVLHRVGWFHRKTLFDPKRVSSIEWVNERGFQSARPWLSSIQIQADRKLTIGRWMNLDKREWLMAVLKGVFDPSDT